MKIYIHVAKENWILDRISEEFSNRWKEYVTDDIQKSDIIWMLSPSPVNALDLPVVMSVQHIDATKYNSAFYSAINNTATCFLTPCQKTKEYMQSKKDITKDIAVLPYWINTSLWSSVHKETSRALINLPKYSKTLLGPPPKKRENNVFLCSCLSSFFIL